MYPLHRIVTQNVLAGGYDGSYNPSGDPPNLPFIINGITACDAIFVGLTDTFAWDQFALSDLKKMFRYPYAYHIQIRDSYEMDIHRKRIGITAFSRYPATFRTIRIAHRNALLSKVQLPGRKSLTIVTVYLHYPDINSGDKRVREMSALVKKLTALKSVMIIGDFNCVGPEELQLVRGGFDLVKISTLMKGTDLFQQLDVLNSEPLQILTDAGFHDAEEKRPHLPTFPTHRSSIPVPSPILSLERGYIKGPINVADVTVGEGPIYDCASDHLPKIFTVQVM